MRVTYVCTKSKVVVICSQFNPIQNMLDLLRVESPHSFSRRIEKIYPCWEKNSAKVEEDNNKVELYTVLLQGLDKSYIKCT